MPGQRELARKLAELPIRREPPIIAREDSCHVLSMASARGFAQGRPAGIINLLGGNLVVESGRRVEYSEHLKFKLQVRRIPQKLPERIHRQARQRYFDHYTGRHIAILSTTYHNRHRLMMIAYDEFDDYVEIVTIHPIKKQQIRSRVNSERWTHE